MIIVVFAVLTALSLVGIDLTVLSVFGGALGVGQGHLHHRIASKKLTGLKNHLDRTQTKRDKITQEKYKLAV